MTSYLLDSDILMDFFQEKRKSSQSYNETS